MEEAERNQLLTKNTETKDGTAIETASANINDFLRTHSKPAFLNVCCLELKPSSTEEDDEDNEPTALYWHPKSNNPLFGIEGIFVVLSYALKDVTEQPAKCTTLRSAQGLTFRVGYYKEDENLMVFAIRQETISSHEVCSLMDCVVRLLQLLYGSLNLAFRKRKCQRKLDKIFNSVEHILTQNNEEFLMPFQNYIPFLPLPKIIQLRIDEILGSLGLADFSRPKSGSLYQQRVLDVVGSCMICNGHVLCSLLSPGHLKDIYLYLKFNQLLESNSLKGKQQIILWREIFPTECQDPKETPFGYAERNSRYFLQIVTLENKTLCILLRIPSAKVSATVKKITPPLFYIEQLKNLLWKLESVIQAFVEKSEIFAKERAVPFLNQQSSLRQQFASLLKDPPVPFSNPSSPKTFENKNETSKDEISKDLRVFNLTIQSPNSSDTVLLRSGILSPESKFGNPSGSLDPFGKQRVDKFLPLPNASVSQNFSETDTLPNIFQMPEYSNLIPIKNLAPCYRGIVVILHLQAGQESVDKGVRINGSVKCDSGLISEFNWCCARIKEHFDRPDRTNRQRSEKEMSVQYPLVKEYGILLRYESKKTVKSKKVGNQDYWVVGRQLSQGAHIKQQVFICFLDSTPQNLIELAFCIPFGHDWTV